MLQQRQMSASRSVRPAISARSIPTTVEYLTLTNATRAFKTKSSVRSLLVLAVFVFVTVSYTHLTLPTILLV